MVKRTVKAKPVVVEEEILTKNEVWDVLKFANNLVSGFYPSIYTPDLLSSRLKDISYSPHAATEDSLARALSDPKNSESELRSFVQDFELISAPFRRILSYMASHLSFDVTYVAKGIDDPKEYKSKIFKKDQVELFDYLDRFDYKHWFRNVVKQLLRNEVYACCIRDDGENIVLQELPLDYVKITSRWDYGFLVSFNFMWFMQPGVDINLYPPFFKQKFREIFGDGQTTEYNPHLPIELRGNSQYVYWVDLPPEVGWAFKFDTSMATSVPYFSGLMPDLINQSVMRNLQRDINLAAASKMLLGAVPMLKDTKSKISDMISIDPATLGKFLALVKSSLSSAIKVAAAPLEDMKAVSFEGDNEMYDSYLRTALASSGMNTSLIYTSQLKANAIESQLSFQSDSLIMEQQLYSQFNAFMNYNCNKYTTKYKFYFEFEGNDYFLDRTQRMTNFKDLASLGIVLPQKLASALGMKPHNLIRMMEESKAMGFTDMLTPIVSGFNMSKDAQGDEGGRPKKKDSEISESGQNTRDVAGNVGRGGKVR